MEHSKIKLHQTQLHSIQSAQGISVLIQI